MQILQVILYVSLSSFVPSQQATDIYERMPTSLAFFYLFFNIKVLSSLPIFRSIPIFNEVVLGMVSRF